MRQRPDDARDAELLRKVSEGDADAFAALVATWWRPLVQYVARILESVDASEDVIQEAFIRLWNGRTDWKLGSSPRVLLYTIARNLAFNERKLGGVRTRLLAGRRPIIQSGTPTPLHAAEGEEMRAAIERAIQALPHQRREVLMLSRYEGLSRAEIAELMGISPQTVANYLAMAITELRQALQPYLCEGDQ